VAIRVSLEVSNVTNVVTTKSGTTAYEIGTRQASTLLQLKDGENQVLAGLINNQERSSGNKVPGLGDIPILGRLFGSTQDGDTKTEIVLSITPHLVRNIERPPGAELEFQTGTETGFSKRPVAVPAEPGKSTAAGTPRGPGVVMSGSAEAATGPAAAGSASASFSAPSSMSRVGEFQPSPPAVPPAAPPASNPVNLSATQPSVPQGSVPASGAQPVPPAAPKEP
jgi:general secretion pathway protein D